MLQWVLLGLIIVNTISLGILVFGQTDWNRIKGNLSCTYYQIRAGGEAQSPLYRTHEEAIEAMYRWLNKYHYDNWTCQNGQQYCKIGTSLGGDVIGIIWKVKVPIWKIKTLITHNK